MLLRLFIMGDVIESGHAVPVMYQAGLILEKLLIAHGGRLCRDGATFGAVFIHGAFRRGDIDIHAVETSCNERDHTNGCGESKHGFILLWFRHGWLGGVLFFIRVVCLSWRIHAQRAMRCDRRRHKKPVKTLWIKNGCAGKGHTRGQGQMMGNRLFRVACRQEARAKGHQVIAEGKGIQFRRGIAGMRIDQILQFLEFID